MLVSTRNLRPSHYFPVLLICIPISLIALMTFSTGGMNNVISAKMQSTDDSSLAVVSAASYSEKAIAPESIVSAFGVNLSTTTVWATDIDPNTPEVQLPTTLGGTTVRVNGTAAPLLFVSPLQINFIIPANTLPAKTEQDFALVEVLSGDSVVSTGKALIALTAPAVFTFDSTGRGVPAAYLLRVRANGEQIPEPLVERDGQTDNFSVKPIDFGAEGEKVFVVLFLSGISRAPDPNQDGNLNETVRVLINGYEFVPSFAGRQQNFAGLDQINFEIPRDFIGNQKLSLKIIVNSDAISNNSATPESYALTAGISSNTTEVFLRVPPVSQALWQQGGLNGLNINAFTTTDSLTIAGTSGGIYNTYDDGATWSEVRYGILLPGNARHVHSLLSLSENFLIAAFNENGVWFSPDAEVWLTNEIDILGLGTKKVLSLSTNNKVVFAGTDGHGIFRRALSNQRPAPLWQAANEGLTNLKVSAIATGNNRVFAGTSGGGVMVSDNNGDRWTAAQGLPAELQVHALTAAGQTVFAGTNLGLWQSIDNGMTWSHIDRGLPANREVNAILIYDTNIFVGTAGSGVFLSNDSGLNWRDFNNGLANQHVLSLTSNSARLFAGTKGGGVFVTPLYADSNVPPAADSQSVTLDEDTTKSIVLRGSDLNGDPLTYLVVRRPEHGTLSGTTPNLVYTPRANYFGRDTFAFRTHDGKMGSRLAIVSITINPVNDPIQFEVEERSHRVAGGVISLKAEARDPDGGEVRVTANTLPPGAKFSYEIKEFYAIVEWIPPAIGTYQFSFTATQDGIESQTKDFSITIVDNPETGSWSQINIPGNRSVYSILVDGSTIYAVIPDEKVVRFDSLIRSSDNGQSWIQIGNGLPTSALVNTLMLEGRSNLLFAATSEGLFRSTDGGLNFINIGSGKGLPEDGARLTLAVSGNKVLVGSSRKISLSLDGGETWTDVTKGLPVSPPGTPGSDDRTIQSKAISGDALLVSLRSGFVSNGPITFRSTDNGKSWQLANNGVNGASSIFSFLGSGEELYALTPIFFHRSTDHGASWEVLNRLFSSTGPPSIAPLMGMAAGNGLLMLQYVNYGVYLSRDDGETWWPINLGLPESRTRKLVVNNSRLFALTYSGKLFIRPR